MVRDSMDFLIFFSTSNDDNVERRECGKESSAIKTYESSALKKYECAHECYDYFSSSIGFLNDWSNI